MITFASVLWSKRPALGADRIGKGYKTQGIVGHTVEFPIAVESANDSLFLVEPIALVSGKKIDWGRVHQVYGKLADVKQADNRNKRVVVIQSGATEAKFGRVATLLAQTAEVTTFPQIGAWSQRALLA
jgi:hypothetical protein